MKKGRKKRMALGSWAKPFDLTIILVYDQSANSWQWINWIKGIARFPRFPPFPSLHWLHSSWAPKSNTESLSLRATQSNWKSELVVISLWLVHCELIVLFKFLVSLVSTWYMDRIDKIYNNPCIIHMIHIIHTCQTILNDSILLLLHNFH